jgi:hypothetical protein
MRTREKRGRKFSIRCWWTSTRVRLRILKREFLLNLIENKKVISRHMAICLCLVEQKNNHHHHSIDPICMRILLKVKVPSVDIHTPKEWHSQDINTLVVHTFLCLVITA